MTKMIFVKLMKPIAFCAMLSMLVLAACSDDEEPSPTPTTNDAVFIKDYWCPINTFNSLIISIISIDKPYY